MKYKRILLAAMAAGIFLCSWGLSAPAQDKPGSKIPDYSLTERKDIPVELTWKVEDIYPGVEAWEKDKKIVYQMIEQLEALSRHWTSSPREMLSLLALYEEIEKKAEKLQSYANLQNDTDLSSAVFQQLRGEIQNLYVHLRARVSFMNADLLQLGEESFDRYVQAEPGLKPYEFQVKKVLRTKAHVLPAEQEEIVSYSRLFSGTPQKVSGILNNVELPTPKITLANGEEVTLNYANYIRYRAAANQADRSLVMHTYWANHKQFENTFAALINGVMNLHLFNACVHHYSNCLEARLFDDNIDPEVYHRLIRSVRENLEPLHRYLKLKQELLGLDQFKYEDIYASSVSRVEKLYSFAEAEHIIIDMMGVLGQDYTAGLARAFKDRWIDRYPNKNKELGYYSSSIYSVHPYIKMNYNGTYETLSALAHELGHAMHSYFANKAQSYVNADYSNFLAEIASTFNENLLVDYLLKHETDDLFKLFILDAFLQQVKGTIYRQVHFAEFELAMHRRVEEGKTLTADWLDEKYLELARYYYGHDKGITEVGDYIQNEWASIPHFFLNYYVYTYSTGMIASTALAQTVLNGGAAAREQYLDFLKTGGSRYPLETLRRAGVDITTDQPYRLAFQRFNQLVTQMETIAQRLKKNHRSN
jgi:oligoendopeptidase F